MNPIPFPLLSFPFHPLFISTRFILSPTPFSKPPASNQCSDVPFNMLIGKDSPSNTFPPNDGRPVASSSMEIIARSSAVPHANLTPP
mmetsp:Transcript_14245/g.41798  ORF Transcript_14245/g.41798 Transcript_14245/m.41798 type:complete len:87 (+) Transcript_14245:164-424(+)